MIHLKRKEFLALTRVILRIVRHWCGIFLRKTTKMPKPGFWKNIYKQRNCIKRYGLIKGLRPFIRNTFSAQESGWKKWPITGLLFWNSLRRIRRYSFRKIQRPFGSGSIRISRNTRNWITAKLLELQRAYCSWCREPIWAGGFCLLQFAGH